MGNAFALVFPLDLFAIVAIHPLQRQPRQSHELVAFPVPQRREPRWRQPRRWPPKVGRVGEGLPLETQKNALAPQQLQALFRLQGVNSGGELSLGEPL